MGDLKNQIFLQYANNGINEVRNEFIQKYIEKKENRFFIKGITYEIGPCRIDAGEFVFEISSKIPQDQLPVKASIDKYFNEVVKILNKCKKKPVNPTMENIVHNTNELELKERDYVKLSYRYKESELYTPAEVEKRFKSYQKQKLPVPDIPGIATPSGKLVIALIKESIENLVRQNVNDLIKANQVVHKNMSKKSKGKAKALRPATKRAKSKTTIKKR